MPNFRLTSFSVRGLYDDSDITIPIRDNKLVIVGVNGLGKSSCLNLLYYFISRQWSKFLEYTFSSVEIEIDDRSLSISREEIESSIFGRLAPDMSGYPALTPRSRQALDRLFTDLTLSSKASGAAQSLSRFTTLMRSVNSSLTPIDIRALRSFMIHYSESAPMSANLKGISSFLEHTITSQILYLPTYRRIEKDLDTVFPGLEEELRRFQDQRRRTRDDNDGSFLELVEFGMEDVKRSIDLKLAEQAEAARAELNNLAGSYLRDVLRGEGEDFDSKMVSSLEDHDVEDILNRVEERTLSDEDKNNLRRVINAIRDGGTLSLNDRYVAHFFVKLVKARQTLRDRQVSITRLVDVCNQYLEGKCLAYDDIKYTLKVVRNSKEIDYSTLSSGEKQVLSLMSQVFLGSASSYIIIIDEPELSLSVSWQQRLLPDLEASGHCSFLAAVTHSPFIYENAFDPYSVDLGECVEISENEVP